MRCEVAKKASAEQNHEQGEKCDRRNVANVVPQRSRRKAGIMLLVQRKNRNVNTQRVQQNAKREDRKLVNAELNEILSPCSRECHRVIWQESGLQCQKTTPADERDGDE